MNNNTRLELSKYIGKRKHIKKGQRYLSFCLICHKQMWNTTQLLKHIQKCFQNQQNKKNNDIARIQALQEMEEQNQSEHIHISYSQRNSNPQNLINKCQGCSSLENKFSNMQRIVQQISTIKRKTKNIALQATTIWKQEALTIINSAWESIKQILLQKLISLLFNEIMPQDYKPQHRINLIQTIMNFFDSLNLSGTLTSWPQKIQKLIKIKEDQQVSSTVISRYRSAGNFLKNYSQHQLSSQSSIILSLMSKSMYMRKGVCEFISGLIKYRIVSPKIQMLPRKILIKRKRIARTPLSLDQIKKNLFNLLGNKNYFLAADLWMVTTLGLRKTQLLKVYFQNENGNIFDLVKVEQKKNSNITLRVLPKSLKYLIKKFQVKYPMTLERFSVLHDFCMNKFSQFYGLRHTCLTNIILGFIKSSGFNFHATPRTTFQYYLDKNNVQMISKLFSLDQNIESQIHDSGLIGIFPLSDQPRIQSTERENRFISIMSPQQFLQEVIQQQQIEKKTLQIENIKKNPLFLSSDIQSGDLLNLLSYYLKQSNSEQCLKYIKIVYKVNSIFQAFCQLIGIPVYRYLNINEEQRIFYYQPQISVISNMSVQQYEKKQIQHDFQNFIESIYAQRSCDLPIHNQDNLSEIHDSVHIFQSTDKQKKQKCFVGKILGKAKFRNIVPSTIKKALRRRRKNVMIIKDQIKFCPECQNKKKIKQCCNGVRFSCQCPNFICKHQNFRGVLDAPPIISSNKNVFDANFKLPQFGSKNNIKLTILQDNKKYTNKLLWSQALPNKIILDLPIVNATKIFNQIGEKEQYLPLQIKQTQDIGKGVFATRKIDKEVIIATYCGEIRTHEQYTESDSILIIGWSTEKEISIVPSIYSNIGRYFNCSDENHPSNISINKALYPCQSDSSLRLIFYFITKKVIKIGEELLWEYGEEYKYLSI